MVYPQNRKSEEGRAFLREEFERVAGELEAVAGSRVTEAGLAEALEIYEDWRGLMREFTELAPLHPETIGAVRRHRIIKSAYFTDKKIHAEKMRVLNGALRAAPPEKGAPKRVILSGLLSEPEGVLEILAENGMTVAADDLAQESRQFRTPAPEGGPALERMAGRAALQDGCAFLYDETKSRGRRLIEEARRRGAVGVIYCQMKFCDPDEFDYPVIKRELEAAGVPLLHIATEQQMDSLGQLMTRVQSFAEMLE
jgi:benzoyl-CoA reductase/2-hydroxyglutaryl-CoA dehydratase subunit BcrC/BadD/HgdB